MNRVWHQALLRSMLTAGAIAAIVVGCGSAQPKVAMRSGPSPAHAGVELGTAATIAEAAPNPDMDCDGIENDRDACPDLAEDLDQFEDDDGCPDADDDADGIPDACDQCPREAETVNGVRDDDGCPDLARVHVLSSVIRIEDRVLFAHDSAKIAPEAGALLDAVVRVMNEHPAIRRIAVVGHAASGERNPTKLSRARADAVRTALLDRALQPDRIVAHSAGTRERLTPDTSRRDHAFERRVRFFVLIHGDEEIARWDGERIIQVAALRTSAAPPARATPAAPCAAAPAQPRRFERCPH